MANQTSTVPASTEPPPMPETTSYLLTVFSDLYRQEVGAEEDVHRTLPFFGTALGIVVAALAYAAGRLPKWADLTSGAGLGSFIAATLVLTLAVVEAACVLWRVSEAIAQRKYQRIGSESDLRARMTELQAYYDGQGIVEKDQDSALLEDMKRAVLESYTAATPANRKLNEARYKQRARAASHLVRSLIWALAATSIIFAADKLGYLPPRVP